MESEKATTHTLERLLAIAGAAASVIIAIRVWQAVSDQQSMWPLPGLYLIKMVAASFIGAWGILKIDSERATLAGGLTWAAIGVWAAFGVMGAWSIGFVFLPVALIFFSAAILANRRRRQNLSVYLSVGALAALAQAALMLALIRLLYPDAIL